MIHRELDVEISDEIYYTDSKVVLGYIQNDSRRFYVYVANRVQTIRIATEPGHSVPQVILQISQPAACPQAN